LPPSGGFFIIPDICSFKEADTKKSALKHSEKCGEKCGFHPSKSTVFHTISMALTNQVIFYSLLIVRDLLKQKVTG
jgi:hypothetical protein